MTRYQRPPLRIEYDPRWAALHWWAWNGRDIYAFATTRLGLKVAIWRRDRREMKARRMTRRYAIDAWVAAHTHQPDTAHPTGSPGSHHP